MQEVFVLGWGLSGWEGIKKDGSRGCFLRCFLSRGLPKSASYVIRESLRLDALVYLQRLLSRVYDYEAVGALVDVGLPVFPGFRVHGLFKVPV